jgi:hypothetical protein
MRAEPPEIDPTMRRLVIAAAVIEALFLVPFVLAKVFG